MKIKLLILVLFAALIFTGCEKEGPVGPAGKDGVANIKTGIVTTTNLSWQYDNSDKSYNATITYSEITTDVVNNGTVQVFIGDGTGNTWGALPFSYSTIQYNYSYEVGKVLISVTLSNGGQPNNPGGMQFKVVAVPSK